MSYIPVKSRCNNCGFEGIPDTGMQGAAQIWFWVCLILGLFTFFVTLIIAIIIWAGADKQPRCKRCSSPHPVPLV